MQTLCLRDILWNRLLWSEDEARRRRRTGDEDFRDPVSGTFSLFNYDNMMSCLEPGCWIGPTSPQTLATSFVYVVNTVHNTSLLRG